MRFAIACPCIDSFAVLIINLEYSILKLFAVYILLAYSKFICLSVIVIKCNLCFIVFIQNKFFRVNSIYLGAVIYTVCGTHVFPAAYFAVSACFTDYVFTGFNLQGICPDNLSFYIAL